MQYTLIILFLFVLVVCCGGDTSEPTDTSNAPQTQNTTYTACVDNNADGVCTSADSLKEVTQQGNAYTINNPHPSQQYTVNTAAKRGAGFGIVVNIYQWWLRVRPSARKWQGQISHWFLSCFLAQTWLE